MKKSQRGITLISLTIYVIVMVVVVAITSLISSYFFTNMNTATSMINPLTEYTKFDSFFTEEVNHQNIKILACENNYIVFDNGVQYTFIEENDGIYRDTVKVCENVENCTFDNVIANGKNTIIVNLQIGTAKVRQIEYVLAD